MPIATSTITDVVVYEDRAIVTRRAAFNAVEGTSTLEFKGLPSAMDRSSVQISGSAGILLRDVSSYEVYTDGIPVAERARLDEELAALRDEAAGIEDDVNRISGERAFLERIAARLTGEQGKPAPSEFLPDHWVRMVDFYRERLSSLDAELREVAKARRSLDARTAAAESRLAQAGGSGDRRSVTVSVTVERPDAGGTELFLSYAVFGPSWRPVYDVRASTGKRTVQVSYNALVSQATGEDWQGVALGLSTAQVHLSGVPPVVGPWYVGIRQPETRRAALRAVGSGAPMKSMAAAPAEYAMDESVEYAKKETAPMAIEEAAVSGGSGASSVEFAIGGETTIPCDGAPHRVGVAIVDLPGVFSYFAAPALEERAYLKAEARNDRDYPFLAGPSRVYLDGAFVSESGLESIMPGESFETSLGVDDGISVKYKTVRTFDSRTGVVGKRAKALLDYRIVLKNRRKTEESVVVKDRMPIPTDQQVTVKLEEPDYRKDTDALSKDETGIFTWTLKLKPGEERAIPFRYSLEYPNGARLTGM